MTMVILTPPAVSTIAGLAAGAVAALLQAHREREFVPVSITPAPEATLVARAGAPNVCTRRVRAVTHRCIPTNFILLSG